MIKIRVQGLPDEVAEFADALEAAGCVLERRRAVRQQGRKPIRPRLHRRRETRRRRRRARDEEG